MAIGSDTKVKKTVFEYQVDAIKAKRELDEIKKKAEHAVNEMERFGSGGLGSSFTNAIKGGIEWAGKLNLAFEGASRAAGFAMDSLKTFGNQLRLESAIGSTNIGKLQDAFDGLVTKTDAMSFAAKAQRGVLKLTQEQMETVAKATAGLTRAGFEQEEVFRKLTEAAIKCKVDGLDDLGLSVKQGKTAAETMSNFMGELNKKIVETGHISSTAADDVQRLSVSWENAKTAAMGYIGATFSIEHGLEKGKGLLHDSLNVITFGGADRRQLRMANIRQQWHELMFGSISPDATEQIAPAASGARETLDPRVQAAIVGEKLVADTKAALALAVRKSGGASDESGTTLRYEAGPQSVGPLLPKLSGIFDQESELVGESMANIQDAMNQSMLSIEERYANFLAGQPTILEKLGLDEASLSGWDIAKTAIQGFSDSFVSSMRSVAQGSLDAEGALKQVAGATVGAIGDQLLAMGAASLVEALAMTVSLNPAAGLKYAAAGIYTAGGLAAHVAASAIMGSPSQSKVNPSATKGASGSAGGGSSGGSTGGGLGGGGGGERGRDIVYVYGDPFSQDNPRQRALTAERAIRKVLPNFGEDS